jgi:hypothetical protein
MPASDEDQRCIFCKIGRIAKKDRDIAFKQSTDKGYISCDVTILMSICDYCGLKTWDENAEAIVTEAVRHKYEELA